MDSAVESSVLQGPGELSSFRKLSLRLVGLPALVCLLPALAVWMRGGLRLSHSYLWHFQSHSLFALHFFSDLAIFVSYLFIAAILLLRLRREWSRLRANWVVPFFVLFLAACAFTQVVDMLELWRPFLWVAGALKLVTAVASIITVATLPPILMKLHRVLESSDRSRLNAERFRAAAESSLDAFYILDSVRDDAGQIVDFRFVYLNDNGARMTTYDRDSLLGKYICEVIPVNRTGGFFDHYKQVVETGVPMDYEFPISSPETTCNWMSSRVVRVGDGVALTCRDISARKEAERELHNNLDTLRVSESEHRSFSDRLQLANQVAQVGVWEWDLATDHLIWDDTMTQLYGIESLPVIEYDRWRQMVHPSDRPEVESVLKSVISNGKSASVDFRMFRADGAVRYISSSQGVVRDPSGRVTRVVGVNVDVTDRRVANARISHLAHHDALTGLPNRELLQDRLRVCLDRSKRFKTRLGVLVIDIDHFKKTNDHLGHRQGDEVLKIAATRLKAQFRSVDTVGRLGGDEFVAVLPDLQSVQDARRLGQKALVALHEPITIAGQEIRITASIGIATFPDGGMDPDLLLHNADTAMYFAKSAGRNNLQIFTEELDDAAARKNRMEDALRLGIANGEFELFYQPQVSLQNHTVTGVEALIRWNSATLGVVLPLEFIPLAEETGLIVAIGEWALKTACNDAIKIQRMVDHPVTMAVNLSPRQFEQDNLSQRIELILAESGLAPSLLEIELTENMLVSDTSDALAILNRIRNLGVRLSIDDFGTGFSSMSYIVKFAIDRLKIDRSFISASVNDLSCRTVTKAIIGLARDLKIEVVAEGVEDEEQRAFLARLGCDDGQGYLFSRPRTIAELPATLRGLEEKAARHRLGGLPKAWPAGPFLIDTEPSRTA
ncbi:PAS domain S-box-containing protein/diguanylate cyclase (GGDEF) domain-containing protein [Granulicella rosea]|uniref:PAS domain S-box-containing protein/diguanylate cyclase (GGDEF) domain-containing protein n=1 Tax=Granulicella rosea TaxID=474952 RepID=A0A239HB40_9BACT|nr:GGDEF and EAL domain-containing protein [Granulicella rosea]SNS78013.1 PAS domain S-box-containing protein/diguanylate cyclase (GGDEF) domain-containing protein [Granulicella rosea]